jgi:dTDP-glucose 4,6-dehydratase
MTAAAVSANPLADDLAHVLAHTDASVWAALRNQNIFVTGGTGFFGRWLLESFAYANATLALNAQLVVLSRNPERFLETAPNLGDDAGIAFVQGDVQDFSARSVRDALGDSAPERFGFVIHAATEASAKLNAENPLLMIDTIVQGTRATLEFAVATGARRFLLTSSGAVYGPQPPESTHVPEDYLGAPDQTNVGSAYGEGKRLAELLCVCFAKQHGIEPILARCFAFVGPLLPLDTHFAIGNFIRDALSGGAIRIGGDGTPFRSYLYAADLAIWLWTLLVRGEASRAYNVGSEDGRSIADMAHAVAAEQTGTAVEIARAADPSRPPQRYVPSTQRAREELKVEEWISLAESIKRTMSYHRALGAR